MIVYDLAGSELASARPDGAGAYRVDGLPPGDVKVLFADNCEFRYVDEWYDNQPDMTSATVITVVADVDIPGVNAVFALPVDNGGWISGRVTDAETGEPVRGICATAYDESGEPIDIMVPLSYPPTDDNGMYRLGSLGTRTVRLEFLDCAPFVYETTWWSGKADFASADPIAVQVGAEVANIDVTVQLKPGGVRPTAATVPPPSPAGELPVTGSRLTAVSGWGLVLLLIGASLGARFRRVRVR